MTVTSAAAATAVMVVELYDGKYVLRWVYGVPCWMVVCCVAAPDTAAAGGYMNY